MSQRCSSSEQIWTPSVRGDVYQIHLAGKKNVQQGHRFAIVVQCSRLSLSTTVIVPTSTAARPGLHRPEIDWDGTTTYALAEQVTAVPTDNLGRMVGHLLRSDMHRIDEALRMVLALGPAHT
jgi:mRNA interferase MazF